MSRVEIEQCYIMEKYSSFVKFEERRLSKLNESKVNILKLISVCKINSNNKMENSLT